MIMVCKKRRGSPSFLDRGLVILSFYIEIFYLIGLLFGFEALYVTNYHHFPWDYHFVLLGIALVHVLAGIAIGSCAAIADLFVHGWLTDKGYRTTNFLHATIGLSLLFSPQFALFWTEYNRPISLKDGRFITGLILVTLAGLFIASLIGFWVRRSERLHRLRGRLRIATVGLSVFFLAIVPIVSDIGSPSGPIGNIEPVDTGLKVVVIGLDGASWIVIDDLDEKSVIPNISRLISEGSSGSLRSIVSELTPFADISSGGMRSPVVWTSITTGKIPRKHGIHDFLFTQISGISRPYPARLPYFEVFKRIFRDAGKDKISYTIPDSRSRRCVALWTLASLWNYRVASIGWWLTYPAESVNGWMISDRPYDRDAVYPEEPYLLAALDEYCEKVAQRAAIIRYFADYPFDPDYREKYDFFSNEHFHNDSFDNLLKDFIYDGIKSRLAISEIESGETEMILLYFFGPDNAEHFYWKYYDPAPFEGVTPEEIGNFGGIIERYYTFIDSIVGEISQKIDDRTVLVLCSDHGMGPWTDDRKGIISQLLAPGHRVNSGNHRPEGILILHGDPIKRGNQLEEASVVDIAPTVLALLGIPVARDFDGEVIVGALEESFLENFPVRVIDTYEGRKPVGRIEAEPVPEKEMDRLKALGYIQ
jgi:predicted AlkP superfamily phosphohydrolase/phosphomutase